MTKEEAAAKCREWAAKARSRAIDSDIEMHSYGYGERQAAYTYAADLIDQIGVPQPWPPPENVDEVLALDDLKVWISVKCTDYMDWEDVDEEEGPFSHYLPMPPAPEEEKARAGK